MDKIDPGSVLTFSKVCRPENPPHDDTCDFKLLILSVIKPMEEDREMAHFFAIYLAKFIGEGVVYNWATPVYPGDEMNIVLVHDYDYFTGKMKGYRLQMKGNSWLDPISSMIIS